MPIDLDFCKVVEVEENRDIVCLLIIDNDKLLCCKRGNEIVASGKWEFPYFNDARRGTAEARDQRCKAKFGVEIEQEYPLPTVEFTYKKLLKFRMTPCICHAPKSEMQLETYEDYRWVTLPELDDLDWANHCKPIVEEAKRWLEKRRYILCIDREFVKVGDIDGRRENYFDIRDLLETCCDQNMSLVEAHRKFIQAIIQMRYDVFERKVRKKWQVIRLYDETGKQIWQES